MPSPFPKLMMITSAVAVLSLGGCSFFPESWGEWFSSSPDGSSRKVEAGWEDKTPAPPPEQKIPDNWAEQSWLQGAPVTDPQSLVEEKKREAEPKGPVINSPTRRLELAEDRINELTREVQDLRSEFNSILPALRQLAESRGQQMPAVSRENIEAGSQVPKPYPNSYIVPDSVSANFTNNVEAVRFGIHSNKVRIVLDMQKFTEYAYSSDGQYLYIDLKGTGWQTTGELALPKSPLFTGYIVQKNPGLGTRMILQLRKPVNVIYADKLEPDKENSHYRIFMDVAAK